MVCRRSLCYGWYMAVYDVVYDIRLSMEYDVEYDMENITEYGT